MWLKNVVIALISCLLAFCCAFFVFEDEQQLLDVKGFGGKLYYADASVGYNDNYSFLRYKIMECNDIGIICKVVEENSVTLDRKKELSTYFLTFDSTTGKPTITANQD